ncbi:MAG: hypothetical protein RIS09_514 [Actinomycetota bacterium]
MPAAISSLTGEGEHVGTFPTADNVIVLLIDGMGSKNLEFFGNQHHMIERLISHVGQTTLPSTTPVALASLGTSMTPDHHGFLGATFLVDGQVLQPLKWTNEPHPLSLGPEPTVFETSIRQGIQVRRVGPDAYKNSGLTNAILRGGEHVSAESLEDLMEILPRTQGPSLTYGYYPKLDRVGHVFGCQSEEYLSELQQVLQAIEVIESRLPHKTTLIVTADHGMVDLKHRVWIEDDLDLSRDIDFIAGEPRFRHIYSAHPRSVLQRYEKVSEDFLVLSKEEFLAYAQFSPDFAERVGDIVVIAQSSEAGLCSREVDLRVSSLLGQHGGATEAERSIPIAVMAG